MKRNYDDGFYDEVGDIILNEGIDAALLYIERVLKCLPGRSRFILNRVLMELEENYEGF